MTQKLDLTSPYAREAREEVSVAIAMMALGFFCLALGIAHPSASSGGIALLGALIICTGAFLLTEGMVPLRHRGEAKARSPRRTSTGIFTPR